MRCQICKHGETSLGIVNVKLERSGTIIIIKDVPAEFCDNCGEYYLSEDISDKVFNIAEKSISKNSEIEILRFVA